ncbi:hypothetical protein TNCV_3000111 [Trichonephila clavipes]|nr:hypothetical protein TNCV_3000111 [Trichonephila clavipes]
MVLKATANDRRHLALCHDEFRGPRSDLCRSGGIGNNNNILHCMSRFKVLSLCGQGNGLVAEFERVMVSSKTRRLWKRCTLNLSRAQTSSRWCDVVVGREGTRAQVSSSSLDRSSKQRDLSPITLALLCCVTLI